MTCYVCDITTNNEHLPPPAHPHPLFNFSLTIVESIPENLTYSCDSPVHPSTYQGWLDLLTAATTSVDIASYYWTLRGTDNESDVTDNQVMSGCQNKQFGRVEEGGRLVIPLLHGFITSMSLIVDSYFILGEWFANFTISLI